MRRRPQNIIGQNTFRRSHVSLYSSEEWKVLLLCIVIISSDLICNRCLLAVCTSEGHVKVYRPPFCDFCAEWIEVCAIEMANLWNWNVCYLFWFIIYFFWTSWFIIYWTRLQKERYFNFVSNSHLWICATYII